MYKVQLVENGVQATDMIGALQSEGYSKDNIYIFAHDKDRSGHLTDATDTGDVGLQEQGLLDSVGNMFKSRGDELRSKFRSLGLSESEVDQYEVELDKGKLVIVASDEAVH
ncbi:general stress protein [Bacillus sp. V3-13]|uniref:general stress protein n=1 Tax=Bacillus sp. V3-13 TaxID=2053728 RepID=UPI000C77B1E8|nr:general stress protein [Bacillus sp. V3-13]PLR79007.1 general stress protein [Bacillus sp. V3-13]